MTSYEYKVVPAPQKGEKTRGIKTPEGRFASAIERAMNEMAADGWEYLRAETLPSEERSGLTSSTNVWRNLLVFRRARVEPDAVSLDGRRLASAADLARESQAAPPVAGPAVTAPAVTAPLQLHQNDHAPSDSFDRDQAQPEAPAADEKYPANS